MKSTLTRERTRTGLSAVQDVRRRISSLVTEITGSRSEISELPTVDKDAIRDLVTYVIGETLTVVDTGCPGRINGQAPFTPPRGLSPDIVREIFRVTVERSWRALIDLAGSSEQAELLRRAPDVFQELRKLHVTIHGALSRPPTAEVNELRRGIARKLLRGEPVDGLAESLGVKLAPSYLVALPDIGTEDGWRDDERHGVFTILDNEYPIALVPCWARPSRGEVAPLCTRKLHQLTGRRHALVAVAFAESREQVPAAVDEAKAVMQVVRTLSFRAGAYRLDDIPIEAALVRSPDLADLLSLRLAPLYGSGAPLLETLRVYLEMSQDRRHAAQALHIHPNTLDYRLRRIKDLTRLSPTVPRDIQTLGAAITAWRLTRGAAVEPSLCTP